MSAAMISTYLASEAQQFTPVVHDYSILRLTARAVTRSVCRMQGVVFATLSGLLLISTSSGQQPQSSNPVATTRIAPAKAGSTDSSEASDRATLVIMAPLGPVLADLRISVAKLPYRIWVGKFLATQLDRNKSDTLTADELSLLTDRIRRLAEISSDEPIVASISGKEEAEFVPATEFADWLRNRLPRAFDLIAQPQAADDAVRLSALLDSDGNGAISNAELLQTFRTLRFRDLDNDETLSIAELMPYRDPRSQNAAIAPDVANLPFFHITDEESLHAAAQRIIARYGAEATIPRTVLRTPGSSPGSSPAEMASLTYDQLISWLKSPEYHMQIDVRLSDRANTSDIDVTVETSAAPFCRIQDDSFGQTAMKIDGLSLKIVARGGGANSRSVTRGFLGQTFVMLDGDRNQYLDEQEFTGLQAALQQSGAAGDFAVIDQNKDGQVTRDELFSFVERDQMATASRIEVSVRQDGRTLFSLLDANQDRRLSIREIRSGTEPLRKFDLDGDGSFEDMELGTEYVLTLGLGQPELRRNSGSMSMMMNGMNADRGDAILPGLENLQGPDWFRRMDRNQDGDVTRREFLGTTDHFQQIDTDGDGLLSSTEATAVTNTAAK
jgi:Ca2+-binding EF-hand superfamily protein